MLVGALSTGHLWLRSFASIFTGLRWRIDCKLGYQISLCTGMGEAISIPANGSLPGILAGGLVADEKKSLNA